MIINLIKDQWIIVKGRDPLLYTLSNRDDVAIMKFEKKEKRGFSRKDPAYKLVFVDVIVKDLNTLD